MIVAVVCGVVIAFGAGARRTSTAPDRYTSSFPDVFDALVTQGDFGRPRDREVASLPGVASVEPCVLPPSAMALSPSAENRGANKSATAGLSA